VNDQSGANYLENCMDREGWILLRAYGPVVVLCVLGLSGMAILSGSQDNSLTIGIFDVLRWVPIALIFGAFALFGSMSYRLWRWWRGDGPSCVTCGGPLGFERAGRIDRGGAFRGCYACGKAVNHRDYE